MHTRLQNLALGVEESRAYWANGNPAVPAADLSLRAFEERWFGAKSLNRVRVLLANLRARYNAFPEALEVLRRWQGMEPATRQVICHWHLQLSDPLYRRFTGGFLVDRRLGATPGLDLPVTIRWVSETQPDRWRPSTVFQFGSKLLSAASEAGLISPHKDPRRPLVPRVPDDALGYLLHLLRSVRFEGTVTANPYLGSVGLEPGDLSRRIRALPGIAYRQLGGVESFDWQYPSLTAWAEATL